MAKQTDELKLQEAKALLEELKEIRGGSVLDKHRALANDPKLLKDFMDQITIGGDQESIIPPKYSQLMTMGMGALLGIDTTVRVHGNGAIACGATIEEIGEVFRMVFMLSGVRGLFMATNVLEPIDFD